MKVFINNSAVIVNNMYENKIFIYDRLNRIEYNINDDMFSILENIKYGNYSKKELYDNYGKKLINQLFSIKILTFEKQQNINNVKRLNNHNNVRIFIELTDRCNLHCKHCYGGFECNKNNIISFEELKKVIDNASQNGVYQFDLTGGEPLLYPNIDELLEYLYNSGMMVRIFTNLTLFNNYIKNLIVKYGVKDIVTSVDSCVKEEHEDFRGVKGCFDKTLNAIDKLKHENINVSVNTMIGNHNKNNINELVKFIDGLKVNSVLDVIVPDGRAKNLDEDILVSSKIIKDIYQNYAEKVKKDAITISCGIGNRFIYIKSDGNIYLCPSLITEKYKLGNINNYDTNKIWSKMENEFLHIKCNHKSEKCKNCSGGCRARALKFNNDICGKDEVYCIINDV